MVTEFGWATGGTYMNERTRPFRTTLRGQARRLRTTYRNLLKNRRRFRLDTAIWFSLQDRRRREGEPNWWGLHTGLRFTDGRAKPAWNAFTSLVGRHT
jgi:hypothetical protein